MTRVKHCAAANDGFLKTHDGIDEGGKKVAAEVRDLMGYFLINHSD